MALNLPEKPNRDDDDSVLKRRLLGAAVFIALAVIILPLVLDGSGSESRFRRVEQLRQEPPRVIDTGAQVAIPDKDKIARPEVPTATQDTPQQAAQSTTPDVTPDATQKTESQPATAANPATAEPSSATVQAISEPEPTSVKEESVAIQPEPPKAESEPTSDEVVTAVAWIVQAGSYADEKNALTLRDQLRDAGFPSFSSSAQNEGTALYRVKVGPINNRREAEAVQKQVETLIGQSTLIRKYP